MKIGAGVAALLMMAGQGAAVAQQPSAQQAFAAAEAKAAANDWAGALAAYDALAARVASPRTRAILSLKRGAALTRLGRGEEAEAAYRAGLAALPANDASLSSLRVEALVELAGLKEQAFDYAGAVAGFRAAQEAAATRAERLIAMAGLVRAGIFVDPAAAAAEADKALAMVDPGPAGKATRAAFLNLKGRALLNAGRAKEASAVLSKAIEENGGLTAKVDRADMAARSDKAIAAILAGDVETARRTLAFTGAGHARDGGITRGSEMQPPPCGAPDDPDTPHPNDVMVVQFMLGDDGAVRAVEPVYASRPGPMVGEFLRAVSNWSWTPERLAQISPFFRSFVRVELRCSTATDRPDELKLAIADLGPWAMGQGIAPAPDAPSAAARLPLLQAELARREQAAGQGGAALLPVMAAIIQNPLVDDGIAKDLAQRGVVIAAATKAPPTVLLWFRYYASGRPEPGARAPAGSVYLQRRAEDVAAILSDPVIGGDARASAAGRLLLLSRMKSREAASSATETLSPVIADPRLSPRDPLKVAANLRLASAAAAGGDLELARAAYDRTGLRAAQCALVDAKPTIASLKLTSSSYPEEAHRWGFEGWTMMEMDVDAAGVPRGIRTVVGYPPFIFGEATAKGLAKTRFTQTYRPEGGLGCGGMTLGVSFALPR